MDSQEDGGLLLDRFYAVAAEPGRIRVLLGACTDALELVHSLPADFDVHLLRAAQAIAAVNRSQTLSPVSDSDVQPTIAIDADGIVRDSNRAARDRHAVVPGDQLANLPFDAPGRAQIREVLNGWVRRGLRRSGLPVYLQLSLRDGVRNVIVALDRSPLDEGVLLLKTAEVAWPAQLERFLRQDFQLTAAETDVVRLLFQGDAVTTIAETRGAAVTTVRSQIRSIYDKTGVGGQTDLVRLLSGLAALSAGLGGNLQQCGERLGHLLPAERSAYPRAEHRAVFDLPEGRILGYSWFGPRNGPVCLFLHDELGGDYWPVAHATRLLEAGWSVLAPARPGFSSSDPLPMNQADAGRFADDVKTLLDHLRISRCTVLARGRGAVHAPMLVS
ncbi:MAG: hypothetical protein H6994_16960, partial [Pseudomonadales bacterium]|nr:hypothetical protein [Pseudomonadales bacterium]